MPFPSAAGIPAETTPVLGGGGGGGGTGTDGAPLITRPTNAGPTTSIAVNRYLVGASPLTIAANALRVHIITVVDTVTVEGANVPAGVGLTFGADGFRTEELNVTIAGSGDVLVVEERAV